jgi:hypothetical protein
VDSYLRALGERERWNIDVLLRMLTDLLPFIYQKAVDTCPFNPSAEPLTSPEKDKSCFSASHLMLYATYCLFVPHVYIHMLTFFHFFSLLNLNVGLNSFCCCYIMTFFSPNFLWAADSVEMKLYKTQVPDQF